MKMESLTKIWNVRPTGVLHVGAHQAEESADYTRLEWGNVIWVEAQPDLAAELVKTLDPQKNQVINATIWGTSGLILEFKVSSNTQSSSLLEFGTHKKDYPDIVVSNSYRVTTSTLEEVLEKSAKFDFINLDIQGVELEALRGLGVHLAQVKWIYTEVNKHEVYENCSKVIEMDAFLKIQGFKRVSTRWIRKQGWGDALYVRDSLQITLVTRLKSIIDYLNWIKQQSPSPTHHLKKLLKRLAVIKSE